MQVPERHDVLGTPLAPPFPEGIETLVVGMGCFWGAERLFWQLDGVYTTAVGYAGGYTPNPTYEEVCTRLDRPHRGRARRLRPGAGLARRDPAHVLGGPRPDAGHAPGQRRRHAVPLGGLLRRRRAARRARRRATRYQASLTAAGLGRDHHRDRPGRPVLLRRGVPPAVPRQEPQRLLRPGRHRRHLPGRPGREGASSPTAATGYSRHPWRGGRVVECGGLENRCGFIAHRGFESLPLRSSAAGRAR